MAVNYQGHAYVKICDGDCRGSYFNLITTAFKHSFKNKSDFDISKKYYVKLNGKEYEATIKYIEDTENALAEKVASEGSSRKRRLEIPASQLVTASETENCSSKETSDGREEEYDKILLVQSQSLLESQSTTLQLQNVTTISSFESEKENVHETDADKENQTVSINVAGSDVQTKTTKGKHAYFKHCEFESSSDESSDTQQSEKKFARKKNKSKTVKNPKSSAKSKSETPKIVESTCGKCALKNKELIKLQHTVQKQTNEIQGLQKENKKIKKKLEYKEADLEEVDKKLHEKEELNVSLQKLLIEKYTEKELTTHQIQIMQEDASLTCSSKFLPVGYHRTSNNTVHVGQNIFLLLDQYNGIINKAQTPALCVGHILAALFTEETLMQSTISGRGSNRSRKKGAKKTENEEENEGVLKLDPTKLVACKEFFEFWLRTEYVKKRTSEDSCSEDKDPKTKKSSANSSKKSRKDSSVLEDNSDPPYVKKQIKKFYHYVTTKIAYYKRKSNLATKLKNKIAEKDRHIEDFMSMENSGEEFNKNDGLTEAGTLSRLEDPLSIENDGVDGKQFDLEDEDYTDEKIKSPNDSDLETATDDSNA